MTLLTGMTEDGTEVPVQVKPDGRLVAEGLPGPVGGVGPAGPAGPQGPQGVKGDTGSTALPPPLYVSDGKVGIGTSNPIRKLTVSNGGAEGIEFGPGQTSNVNHEIHYNRSTAAYIAKQTDAAQHIFNSATGEVARIDSFGRLLVGTSSSVHNLLEGGLQLVGTSVDSYFTVTRYSSSADAPAGIVLGRSKSATKGTNAIVASGDALGAISFSGANGTSFDQAVNIVAYADGTPGASGDMPGQLVFSTTAVGTSSPMQRMTIRSTGVVNLSSTPVYADNTAARAGGLDVGDVYRTATGQLMIAF